MEKLKKNIWLVLISILLVDFVLIYFQNFYNYSSNNIDYVNRGIESNFKIITNGYLGIFFNVKYFGLFSWLIIPIGIYYSKKNKYYFFLFILFLIIALIIGFLGYINFRYAYTFTIPIQLIIAYFLFSNNLFSDKNFTLVFVFLYLAHFVFFVSIDMIPKYYNRIQSNLNTTSNKKSIYKYIDENIKSDSVFLVNNIPQFYYYTKRFGYFYWCKDDELFTNDKRIKLFNTQNLNSVHKELKQLKVNYIFSDTLFNMYSSSFHKYLRNYTKPIYRQERLVVYQLK